MWAHDLKKELKYNSLCGRTRPTLLYLIFLPDDLFLVLFQDDASPGLDFWLNEETVRNASGKYSTNLFTSRAVSIIKNRDQTKVSMIVICQCIKLPKILPHCVTFLIPFFSFVLIPERSLCSCSSVIKKYITQVWDTCRLLKPILQNFPISETR